METGLVSAAELAAVQTGEFRLASIVLTALQEGGTSVQLISIWLSTPDGNLLSGIGSGAFVTVEDPTAVVPEPAFLPAVGLVFFAGLRLRARR
ncbi:MAG TPA: hypothetical protein VE621_16935 [Bryobacteraceae bacterium]|nr:hypothetical protein [Bryobacteraceae bacterium]